MQSSDSCVQSQGLESAHQPSRGVTAPRSVGKQQERKEERWGEERKGEMKPAREGRKNSRRLSELVVVGDRGKKSTAIKVNSSVLQFVQQSLG